LRTRPRGLGNCLLQRGSHRIRDASRVELPSCRGEKFVVEINKALRHEHLPYRSIFLSHKQYVHVVGGRVDAVEYGFECRTVGGRVQERLEVCRDAPLWNPRGYGNNAWAHVKAFAR
jgi:hypothetical protein